MDYPIPAVTGQGQGSISTHQHQRIHPLTFSLALALQQTGLPLDPFLNTCAGIASAPETSAEPKAAATPAAPEPAESLSTIHGLPDSSHSFPNFSLLLAVSSSIRAAEGKQTWSSQEMLSSPQPLLSLS